MVRVSISDLNLMTPQNNAQLFPFDFWSDADDDAATREGWILTNDSDDRVHIARLDDPADCDRDPPLDFTEPKFGCDEEAQEYVAAKASRGCILHLKAIFLMGHPIRREVYFRDIPSLGIREPGVYSWPNAVGLWKHAELYYWAEPYKSDDAMQVRAVHRDYAVDHPLNRWYSREAFERWTSGWETGPANRWFPVHVSDDIPRNLSGNYPVGKTDAGTTA
jgi:hypothetical protein